MISVYFKVLNIQLL